MTSPTPRATRDIQHTTHQHKRYVDVADTPLTTEVPASWRRAAPRTYQPTRIEVVILEGAAPADWAITVTGPMVKKDGTLGATNVKEQYMGSAAPTWVMDLLQASTTEQMPLTTSVDFWGYTR